MKWRNLLELGTVGIGDSENHRRIVLSNVIYLLTAGLLIFFLGVVILMRGYYKAPTNFGTWVPYILITTSILSLSLNSLGYPGIAKIFFTLTYMLSVSVLPILLQGTNPGAYYTQPIFCIMWGLMIHLLFSFYSDRFWYICMLTLNMLLTVFSVDFLLAFDPSENPVTPWVNSTASYHLINFICWTFMNVTLFYLLRINWRFYTDLQLKHTEVEELNHALEKRVEERTRELSDRNERLSEYAFMIAHILRAPISRIRGLLNLSHLSEDRDDEKKIRQFLEESAKELDAAVHSISEKLNEGKKS